MTVIDITGPTAPGKTALPLEFVEALDRTNPAEIISIDVIQLYRGMDVGTARISPTEWREIAHRQIDVPDVLDEASVATYQRDARADIDAILAAGKAPAAVGGPGPYVPGLLDRLGFPGRGRCVRAELGLLLEKEGPEPLLEELARKDPQTYETMDLANTCHLVRVLEAIRMTNRPYASRSPRYTARYPSVRLFGAFWSSNTLNAAIDRSTKEMMASELIKGTRELMNRSLVDLPTAGKATGYIEAMAIIEGRVRIEGAVEPVCLVVRRLAKRQTKWFRADP